MRENKFTAEDYGQFSAMKFGGSSLSPLRTFEKKIPEAVRTKVKEREQEIRDGLFRVNVNDSEPKSSM